MTIRADLRKKQVSTGDFKILLAAQPGSLIRLFYNERTPADKARITRLYNAGMLGKLTTEKWGTEYVLTPRGQKLCNQLKAQTGYYRNRR